jgi:hypothetical protein
VLADDELTSAVWRLVISKDFIETHKTHKSTGKQSVEETLEIRRSGRLSFGAMNAEAKVGGGREISKKLLISVAQREERSICGIGRMELETLLVEAIDDLVANNFFHYVVGQDWKSLQFFFIAKTETACVRMANLSKNYGSLFVGAGLGEWAELEANVKFGDFLLNSDRYHWI